MASTTTDRLAGVTAGLSSKAPVRAATTANITLSGEQTINSVAVVADDRVAVKNQTDGTENGIYDVKSGAWVRSKDFDGTRDVVSGTFVIISEGGLAGTLWYISTTGDITIGTTSITFTQMTVTSATAFAQTLLDDANAAAARATLELVIGTNVQAFHALLADIAGLTLAQGDVLFFDGTDITNLAPSTAGDVLTTQGAAADPVWGSGVPRGFISGFVVTNNATDPPKDVDISIGSARDAADTLAIATTTAFGKQGDVAFAKGGTPGTPVGGLGNAVTLPTSGTIHVHAITEDVGGDVDFYFDTSVSGANAPTGWTFRRRVESLLTDATPDILPISAVEIGGGAVEVLLDTVLSDEATTNPGTSAVLVALSTPADIATLAKVTFRHRDPTPSVNSSGLVTSPDQTDIVPSDQTGDTLISSAATGDITIVAHKTVRTDTSSQIRYRVSDSPADCSTRIATNGWIDPRV